MNFNTFVQSSDTIVTIFCFVFSCTQEQDYIPRKHNKPIRGRNINHKRTHAH